MAEQFKLLFSPLTVGSMTIRNRIVLPPHGVTFSSGQGDNVGRIISYLVERAKGGVGMIVKSDLVRPASWERMGSWGGLLPLTDNGQLNTSSDDSLIPMYRRLATEVHLHGAKLLVQLNAPGRQGPDAQWIGAYQLPAWAPSPLPCPEKRQIPKEMEVEDIQDYVEAYAHGARNMQEAGMDGVELFAAQGYLLSEFLSPHVNRRTDQYGGSLENRMRFILEALEAIRKAVGRDFVVGVRMNGDDYVPGGLTLDVAVQVAMRLAESGCVDYLNISGMTYYSWPGWIADMTSPTGVFTHLSRAIKKAGPGVPLCVVTRIVDPVQAERILAEGRADMVGMVRALIADPELPLKAQRGDLEDIRHCIYSNVCLTRLFDHRGVSCIQNPSVGHEAHLGMGTLRPAPRKKRVLVVGGGPAGMAAARIAAQRGHRVTLVEKETQLGGQNNMTARISSRQDFAEVTRWQEYQLRKAHMDIRLGVEATVDLVLAQEPDAVVVATGATPLRTGHSSQRPDVLQLPGVERENVLTIWDVFRDGERVGKSVVLIDEDPHLAGIFTAEYLADHGRRVEVLTPGVHPARELEPSFVPSLYRRVLPKGIVVTPNTLVTEIQGNAVVCRNRYTSEERHIAGVDTVVLAMGSRANNELYTALKGKVTEVYAIGDCLAPRRLEDAITDGERIGRMV